MDCLEFDCLSCLRLFDCFYLRPSVSLEFRSYASLELLAFLPLPFMLFLRGLFEFFDVFLGLLLL